MKFTSSDAATLHGLSDPGGGLPTWQNVALAGRGGMPASATAAYVSIESCSTTNPFVLLVSSSGVTETATPAADSGRRIVVDRACPATFEVYPPGNRLDTWLPLVAGDQTIRYAGNPMQLRSYQGRVRLMILGWVE